MDLSDYSKLDDQLSHWDEWKSRISGHYKRKVRIVEFCKNDQADWQTSDQQDPILEI